MIASLDPANGPSSWNDDSLARTLRLDLEDEERRALLGSYAISTALGIAFLLLQQFGPRSERVLSLLPERAPRIVLRDLTSAPEPTAIPRALDRRNARTTADRSVVSTSAAQTRSSGDQISNAFSSRGGSPDAGLIGDPRGMLQGVELASGTGDVGAGSNTKRVLGFAEGGQGSAIPGRTGLGIARGGDAGIGGVREGRALGRATVDVSGPVAVTVTPPDVGGGASTEVGTFVRGREPELRFCYEESLKVNPSLAGSVTVAITLSGGGAISDARVTRRTWSGRGAAEAEACMLRAISAWRLAGPGRGSGTYSFPFSFTR